jgi:opacity protein-like surface antigen
MHVGPIRPYIGGGAGIAIVDWETTRGVNLASPIALSDNSNSDDTDLVTAAQAFAGIDFFVSENWTLFAEYKFLYLDTPEIRDDARDADYELADFYNQILVGGIKVIFR